MNAKDIAELLGVGEWEVKLTLGEYPKIASLKTPKEALALYMSCSGYVKLAVMEKWKELTIPTLKTPKEALALYRSCPSDMDYAVMEKWKELVLIEIPLLKTPEDALALYRNCPRVTEPAIIEAMAKL